MKKNSFGLPYPPMDQFWTVRWSPDGGSIILELKDATRLFDNVIATETLEVREDFEFVVENLSVSAQLMLERIESRKDLVKEVNDNLIGDWL